MYMQRRFLTFSNQDSKERRPVLKKRVRTIRTMELWTGHDQGPEVETEVFVRFPNLNGRKFFWICI